MPVVLVADDDVTNRQVLTVLLGYQGHTLLEAADGAEALTQVRKEHPDLVIADVLMPVMDGYEFVRQLRQEPEFSTVPVVFYTASYLEREARALAEACGVHYVITKPAEPEQILSIVAQALGSSMHVNVPRSQGQDFDREHVRLLTDKLSQNVNTLQASNQRLADLITATRLLASESDSEHLLAKFCSISRSLIGARQACVGILSEDRSLLDPFFTNGHHSEMYNKVERVEAGILTQLLKDDRPLRIDHISDDPLISRSQNPPLGKRSFLGAKLGTSESTYGVVWVLEKIGGGEFSGEDEGALMSLAAQASVAYENIQRHLRQSTLERQLLQAQKMEAVGRLAAGVAHDFNNMLMIITGSAEILEKHKNNPEKVSNCTSHIRQAAKTATSVVRQLLAFSRKQIPKRCLLDLNSVISDLSRMLPRLLGEDIELKLVLGAGAKYINADPGYIEQIIINLAVNARDAMPQGGVLIVKTDIVEVNPFEQAETPTIVPSGKYITAHITDTGIGMSPEVQAHLFEPFFTTKEPGKGTGLGLATVYGIVRQSNGYIFAASEPGKGTTFTIYFPIVETEVAEAVPAQKPDMDLEGNETILLVEDQLSLRQVVCEYLESKGYRVLTAGSADEALRLRKNHAPIEFLITDVILPGMPGTALAKEMLADQPDLKVIYISGYTDRPIAEELARRNSAFLQKPFSLDELGERLREMLVVKRMLS